jgi:peptide/nickel transport system substrate-binding protein
MTDGDCSRYSRKVFIGRTATGLAAFPTLAAFLAACGANSQGGKRSSLSGTPAEGQPPASPTGTLRIAIANPPQTLDPTLVTTVADMTITETVYEPLVVFSGDYSELAPGLATSWRANQDATEWEFTLRDGVTFHDGSTLDAKAVRESLEYVTRSTSFYAFLLGEPTIEETSNRIVTVRYERPFPDLLNNLTFACGIVSPKALQGAVSRAERRVASTPAGTGPFTFERKSGQAVTLRASEGYWGDGPYVETLEFVVIPDETARTAALQAGDVDIVLQVPPRAADNLRSSPNLHVVAREAWTTTNLMAVCNRKPFSDARVRQAMAYALDREAIVKSVLLGQAVVDDSMFPPGIPGHHVPPTRYRRDVEKARDLLSRAGYPNGVSIKLSTRSDQVLVNEISQALAGQLREAGFDVAVDVLDIAVFEADKAKPEPEYELHWNENGWVTGGPLHFTLGGIAAQSKWENREYEGLLARFKQTPNGPTRDRISAQAIDLWAREVPWMTLWIPSRADSTVSEVQAYQASPRTAAEFDDAYLAAA